MAIPFRFLSLCPRIRKEEDRLVASTPWRLRLLTMGAYLRTVVVDPDRKQIVIRRRLLWFIVRKRRVPFDAVRGVTYGYRDMTPGGSWMWAHDSSDLFHVGLKLDSLDKVHLFSFFGDGTFHNDGPLPDWLYWDNYLFDMSGTQERESRAFVELLSKMIKAPVEAD